MTALNTLSMNAGVPTKGASVTPESTSAAQINTQDKVTATMDTMYAKFQCLIEDPDGHRLVHTNENGYTQMRM